MLMPPTVSDEDIVVCAVVTVVVVIVAVGGDCHDSNGSKCSDISDKCVHGEVGNDGSAV